MSCLVSASNHMVVFRASISSLVSQSLARSQIQGGSVTWASQSKVGKSLVMGANCCKGMLHLLLCLSITTDSVRTVRAVSVGYLSLSLYSVPAKHRLAK